MKSIIDLDFLVDLLYSGKDDLEECQESCDNRNEIGKKNRSRRIKHGELI